MERAVRGLFVSIFSFEGRCLHFEEKLLICKPKSLGEIKVSVLAGTVWGACAHLLLLLEDRQQACVGGTFDQVTCIAFPYLKFMACLMEEENYMVCFFFFSKTKESCKL